MILRELLLKLGLDIDEAKFAKGELAASLLEAAFDKVVETANEFVEKFIDVIKETAEAGEQIEVLSQVTGLGAEELQNLSGAAGFTGVSMQGFSAAMRSLSRNMLSAKEGSEEQQKAFSKLGIKTKDASGHLRSAGDVLLDISDHFVTMPDGAEKTGQAMQLLGKAGADMIPFLNKGREGIEELASASVNMSEEQIKAGSEIVLTQKMITVATQNLWQQAIMPLLPAIDKLLKRYLEWRRENAKVMSQRITQYIGYIITGIEKLSDAFGFLVKNIGGVEIILGAAGLTGIMITFGNISVMTAIKTGLAWAMAALPFVAIAAAIAAVLLVYDDLRTYNEDQDKHSKKQHSLFGVLKQHIDDLYKDRPKPPFLQDMLDFVSALANGGREISSFKRDVSELFDLLGETFNKLMAVWEIYQGIINKDPKQLAHGAQLYGEIEKRNAPAIAGGNSLGGGGAPYIPGISPTFKMPIPEMLARQGDAYVTPSSNHTQISIGPIVQQPGESQEQLVEKINTKIDEHWNMRLEEAASGVLK